MVTYEAKRKELAWHGQWAGGQRTVATTDS